MLDLREYQSLGEALRAAPERWPDEVCLIEADRERENARLTYSQFKQAALPLAGALQHAGLQSGTRAAIIMTNQSKWLISAYAIFFCGGVLVPLDYKLTASEQLQLLAHSKTEFLIVEYHLWRAITQAESFKRMAARVVLVTEAPANAELGGAKRWEEFVDAREPVAISEHLADEPCDRFHDRFYRAFHVRRGGCSFAHSAPGIYSRGFHSLQNHVHDFGPHGPEESGTRTPAAIRRSANGTSQSA